MDARDSLQNPIPIAGRRGNPCGCPGSITLLVHGQAQGLPLHYAGCQVMQRFPGQDIFGLCILNVQLRFFNHLEERIMKEFLSFDTMLTPKVIIVVYFLLLLAVVVTGISAIFYGGLSLSSLLGGVFGILLGGLVVRMYCEIFIVFFKINEALQEIRKK
jgi:hypothetical protein